MARATVFYGDKKTSNYHCATGINLDVSPVYFKNIGVLGKGRSRKWEIRVGKRLDEGRRMIECSFRDVHSLLKKMAKEDASVQPILNALKGNMRELEAARSERFSAIENAFSNIRPILREHDALAELDSMEKRFRDGKDIFEKARTELVEKNLRLTVPIAKSFFNNRTGLTLSDVIQEGNCGLMKAAERYRYKKGFHFSTYAAWWIRQTITRAYMNHSRDIRVPVHRQELGQKISRVQRDLYQRFAGASKPEEVAAALGITPEDVLENAQMFNIPYSIDMEVRDTGMLYLKDVIRDKNERDPEALYASNESTLFLKEIVEQELKERERFVILKRFGLDGEPPQTLEEVGKVLHITRERIRQIENEALEKLRSPKIIEKLKTAVL